jgi:two-component system sensor histidine kinase KdpD
MVTSPHERPRPEAFLAEIESERRGGLKIFLGASPGVGKTYKMLQAAQEARRTGVDIVIGVVESHGRKETEDLCEGLERIPLRPVEYRGARFREMDLDAILQRSPKVVLVDELAHRNVPGTRHPRRYQDIEEILDRDIDVWTTVNIQHLESLNDVVARITGVRMRETVPDELLARARDVVLVDLTPRELIERLKQGKVYVPEQARAALDSFFNPSNLAALRELAFQTVAERIDIDVRDAMRRHGVAGPWPVKTRVVVAVDGISNSEELVRLGRRIAERRRAPWAVAYVERGDADPERLANVERAFRLAERLGAETIMLRGQDPIAEILNYAREYNATTLIVGRDHPRRFARLFGRAPDQRLLREGREFEITFVPTSIEQRPKRVGPGVAQPGFDYLFAAAIVAGCTILSALIAERLPLADPSLIFLLGVLWVAVRTAVRPALFAALLSALAYNFFFIEPRFSITVGSTGELAAVLFFLVIALIGGRLAARLRQQVRALTAAQQQAQALLGLSRRLGVAPDAATVRREIIATVSDYLRVPVVLLAPPVGGGPISQVAASRETLQLEPKEIGAAQWAFDHRQPSGFETDTLSGLDWRFLPLVFERDCFGVIGIGLGMRLAEQGILTSEQLSTVEALVNTASLALARVTLAASLDQAKLAEETARLRSVLLSSVSYDLHAPLTSMIGAAAELRSQRKDLSAHQKELLDSVISEGERLNRYVQNLLDMTRLGYGDLKLSREWIDIEEIVDSALRRTHDLLGKARVVRAIAPNLPPLYVHPALIEQVLFNVLENAAKFSPEKGEIRITAQREDGEILITISDQGPGIPPEQRENIFDMFTPGGEDDRSRYPAGLGLAISRSMVAAHGGRIDAREGPGGVGTTIAIHLPLPEAGSEK